MKIRNKVKEHFQQKKFARITRTTLNGGKEISRGYILAYSKQFIVLHDIVDFLLSGYHIIEIDKIKKMRYNANDKHYDFLLEQEGEKKKSKLQFDLDLSNWQRLFESIIQTGKNVIIEQEGATYDSFLIGPLVKTSKKKVQLRYFNAEGVLDKKPTVVKYKKITKVVFNDRYIDVYSKYLRHS